MFPPKRTLLFTCAANAKPPDCGANLCAHERAAKRHAKAVLQAPVRVEKRVLLSR
jgi:hypothetical protein